MNRYQANKLMESVFPVKSNDEIVNEFVARVHALEVGQQTYQCFITGFPPVQMLQRILDDSTSTKLFEVWETINGIVVKRKA